MQMMVYYTFTQWYNAPHDLFFFFIQPLNVHLLLQLHFLTGSPGQVLDSQF